jgi:prepilin-type N-terminal cleavage/methylation domain-containing protein
MRRRLAPGFTLIELVLALSILAVMITVLFGGLRMGLRAWQRGEDRAAALQHARSMTQLIDEALGGTYGYAGVAKQGTATPVIFFKGQSERLSFVTASPPISPAAAIPFVAVTLSIDAGTAPGLAIREKALPNFDPFETVAPSVVDPTITAIRFRYLREAGSWEESWDAVEEHALPQAVEVTLTSMVNGRAQESTPITVPIRVNAP